MNPYICSLSDSGPVVDAAVAAVTADVGDLPYYG